MPKGFYVCPQCGGTLATRYKETPPVVTCLDEHEVRMEFCGDWPKGLEKMRERRSKIRREVVTEYGTFTFRNPGGK